METVHLCLGEPVPGIFHFIARHFGMLQYGIDMPMTVITHVKGANAHPFYKSLKREENYVPKWNFSKVLIGPDGSTIATYGSRISPTSSKIENDIEALLN